jgi:general stress protein CsbA
MIGLYLIWRCIYTVFIPIGVICWLFVLLSDAQYSRLVGTCTIIIAGHYIVSWMEKQHSVTIDVYVAMQRPNPQDHPGPSGPRVHPVVGRTDDMEVK